MFLCELFDLFASLKMENDSKENSSANLTSTHRTELVLILLNIWRFSNIHFRFDLIVLRFRITLAR